MKAIKNIGILLLVVVFVVAAIFDVISIALLMVKYWGLPYGIAILLSGIAFALYIAIVEISVLAIGRLIAVMKSKRKVSLGMNRSQLSELLSNMNELQADSFEARKALIRESFLATQVQQPIQAECEQQENSNNENDTIWL